MASITERDIFTMANAWNNSCLISLLGEELYKDYFDNEQGGVIDIDSMGGTTGGDASSDGQACALEQLVDSLLMEANETYERSNCESKNTIP